MSNLRIRVQHDELDQIEKRFSAEAESASALSQTLRQQVATLQGADWIGPGASAFYAEMSGAVFPALLRLGQALATAARCARQIQRLFREAESDAADVLRRHAQAGAASAAGFAGRPENSSADSAANVMNAFGLGPQTRSSMAGGGWGGALGGAAIGSAICPGVGTVIGGIIGGLAGGGVGEWIGRKFFD